MEDMQRLVRVEESDQYAHKRLDKIEKDIDEIHSISLSVHEIATEMKAMRQDMNNTNTKVKEDFNSINNRVKDIENKPARKYERIGDKIIDLLIGAVIGYILVKLGLGG